MLREAYKGAALSSEFQERLPITHAGRFALLPSKGTTKHMRERLKSPLVLGTNHRNEEKSHG
ncbi:MAG: hypothetical protein QM831_22330 [Kofleriaceae bacterium]